MKRRGIILDATLRVYVAAAASARPGAKPYHCTPDLAARLANQAWREGVTISAGTDGHTLAVNPYPALHEELELLVEKAGMPPAQVIRSATLVGAMTIGQDKAMGTIAPGKLANMVVVEKNPLENIRNLRSVLLTVKRGHRFPRLMFRPISREEADDDD
jgi:imidazolonepropionase-like amidohydrolase